jgi:hypothetical protein
MVKRIIQDSGLYNMFHQSYIQPINSSKLFAGILMILMNIGSKYIEVNLSKSQEHVLRNGVGREIVIFCVVFLGTRDLVMSIIMTSAFIILTDHLFNEESCFCIMPKHLKYVAEKADKKKEELITPQDEKKARELLERAKKMRNKKQQGEFLSYMDKYSDQTFEDQTFSDQFYA